MTDRYDPKAIADELREAQFWAERTTGVVGWGSETDVSVFRRAADTIDALVKERDQAIRDLDAGFAESDHLSAKYYQRMRAAEKEMHARELHHFEEEQRSAGLTSRLDRVHKLTQPWADRIDLEQVGTHSPDCYTRHVDCLILSIRHTIENDQTEGNR